MQRQAIYDSIYGNSKGNWCSLKGLLKISLMLLLGLVALVGVLAYTNPEWEVWNGLFEDKEVSVRHFSYCKGYIQTVFTKFNSIFYFGRHGPFCL